MRYSWTVLRFLSIIFLVQSLNGCAKVTESGLLPFMGSSTTDENLMPDAELASAVSMSDNGVSVRPGGWLSINVNDNALLSSVVMVTQSGDIGLPQIGKVHVAGMTAQAAEKAIAAKLHEKDLTVTKVRVGFFQSGPVYVLGEVQKSGEFAFSPGIALADLIDQAGGVTYRADSRRVFITRYNQPEEIEMPATRTTQIMPGDVIRVPQRYF